MLVSVEICRANLPTISRKIYSRELLESQVNSLQEAVKNRTLIGTLGTPNDAIIKFLDASHVVTKLFMDGDKMMADIEILDTPSGKELKAMKDVGFYMAGIGSGQVNDDGNLVVDENYKLVQIYGHKQHED